MGFLSLLLVASMPVIQLLLIGSVGAFLASGYSNVLSSSIRHHLNKILFTVFTPSLVFSSLAKTVTFQDLISWWFMPVNIGITFVIGGTMGWVAVKVLKPKQHLEGLIIANCSAGNLGNLMLLIIPAVCAEAGSPFGDEGKCSVRGLSYVSLSMALGSFFIWTHTYNLMKNAGATHEKLKNGNLLEDDKEHDSQSGEASTDKEAQVLVHPLVKAVDDTTEQAIRQPLLLKGKQSSSGPFWKRSMETIQQIVKELMAPPTIAVMAGFIVGAIPWLKSLIIGADAPLRVFQNSFKMLGDATLPCTTLILGGNLTSGLKKSTVKPSVILAIAVVRYAFLPITGIAVVKAADALKFLPEDPLFQYVLLTQFTLPPAVAIGVLTQLFEVGQEESSVIFLWLYLAAAFALTFWSTVFMYIIIL